jgi:formate dehydrogenase subunit gamma
MSEVTETWDADRALTRIRELKHLPGALLPILQALQQEFGSIDSSAVPMIAGALNLSHAEVQGVISFYHDFRHSPPCRHILRICRAEFCQSMGCEALLQHIEKRLGVKLGETTNDQRFTIEAVYCLGMCGLSPSVMLDGKPLGRVSPEVADFLIDDLRRRQ